MLGGDERTGDENHDSRRRLPHDSCCSAHREYAIPTENQASPDNVDRHWNVALLASLTALVTVVSVRNLGFFFVHFREDLAGNSREAAAWPLSVLEVFSHLGGFPVALLGQRLDVFQIAVAGSVLVWAGLALASLAGSIFWMSVTFGVVHGYYRDNGGSYDNLYRVLGFIQACVGSALLGVLYSGKGADAVKETSGCAAPLKMNHDSCTLIA
ncbi:uncharacterized protein LOC144121900 isoform X2 [Amblyomma americanum]